MTDDQTVEQVAPEIAAQIEPVVAAWMPRYTEWDEAWEGRHSDRPEALYHYTNPAGLLGIVREHQLWASNALFLNDSAELVHIQKILDTVLLMLRADYSERRDHTDRAPLRLLQCVERLFPASQEWWDVYVACFCGKDDLLSQWRGYPGAGGGYAIGFNTASLVQAGGVLRQVVYHRETQHQMLQGLLKPACETIKGLAEPAATLSDKEFARAVQPLLAPLAMSFLECSFCFKHPGFDEEAEWRLIYVAMRERSLPLSERTRQFWPAVGLPVPSTEGLRMRPTATGLVPYIERHLARPGRTGETPAIRDVVVGPTAHRKLAREATAQLLGREGYENAPEMVRHSAIPLRA
jgi:hypothetical protein